MGRVSSCWTAKKEISTTTQPAPHRGSHPSKLPPLVVAGLLVAAEQVAHPAFIKSQHLAHDRRSRPPEEIDRKLLGIMAS